MKKYLYALMLFSVCLYAKTQNIEGEYLCSSTSDYDLKEKDGKRVVDITFESLSVLKLNEKQLKITIPHSDDNKVDHILFDYVSEDNYVGKITNQINNFLGKFTFNLNFKNINDKNIIFLDGDMIVSKIDQLGSIVVMAKYIFQAQCFKK